MLKETEAAIEAGRHMLKAYQTDPRAFMANIARRGQYLYLICTAYYALVREKLLPPFSAMDGLQYIEYHKKAAAFYSGSDDYYIERLIKMQAAIDYFQAEKGPAT